MPSFKITNVFRHRTTERSVSFAAFSMAKKPLSNGQKHPYSPDTIQVHPQQDNLHTLPEAYQDLKFIELKVAYIDSPAMSSNTPYRAVSIDYAQSPDTVNHSASHPLPQEVSSTTISLIEWWTSFSSEFQKFALSIENDIKLAAFLSLCAKLEKIPVKEWSAALCWVYAELPLSPESDIDRGTVLSLIESLTAHSKVGPETIFTTTQGLILAANLPRLLSAIEAKRRLDNILFEAARTSVGSTTGLLDRFLRIQGDLKSFMPYAQIVCSQSTPCQNSKVLKLSTLLSQAQVLRDQFADISRSMAPPGGYLALSISRGIAYSARDCVDEAVRKHDGLMNAAAQVYEKILNDPSLDQEDRQLAQALRTVSPHEYMTTSWRDVGDIWSDRYNAFG